MKKNEINIEVAKASPTHSWFIQGAVSLSQGQRGQSSPPVFTPNDLQHSERNDTQSPKHLVRESGGGTQICGSSRESTLIHGGMPMLRLHRTCWLSSYLVDLRRKDRNPVGSLLLSLTLCIHKKKIHGGT